MSTAPDAKPEQHELKGSSAVYFRAGARAGQSGALADASDNVRRFAAECKDTEVAAALVSLVADPMAERAKACQVEMGRELAKAKMAKRFDATLPAPADAAARGRWQGFGLGAWAMATLALLGRVLGWW